MKILLDVKALERMIAGDSEVEIEIRNGIVQEFAKRHLKVIASSEDFQRAIKFQMDSVRLSVEMEMSEVFMSVRRGDSWNNASRETFKEKIKEKIKAEASLKIDLLISKTITEMVEARLADLAPRVNAYCDSILEKYTRRTLDEMVEEKFRKAIART